MAPQAIDKYRKFTEYFIAIGANLSSATGSSVETLKKAIGLMESESLNILAQSAFYSTPAFPAGSGPDFVNGALRIETCLSAQEVLDALHDIEARLGRQRVNRWEPRVVDLDLLACGQQVLPDLTTYETWRKLPVERQKREAPEQIILPHPRLHERGFVLVPLNDVAGDWVHPVLGQTVAQMLAALLPEDLAGIKVIKT